MKWSIRNALALLRWLSLRLRYGGRVEGMFFLDRGATVFLGPNASLRVGHGVIVLHDLTARIEAPVSFGDRVFFNRGCHVVVKGGLEVGDDVLFGEYVSIHDESHIIKDGMVEDRNTFESHPIKIGRKVWVGAKATILPGVEIGERCVVGANAVVTKNLPPGAIAVGVPARVIGYLDAADDPDLSHDVVVDASPVAH